MNSVSVQQMGGNMFSVQLLVASSTVGALKRAVVKHSGYATWTQHLFRIGESAADATPLDNSVAVSDGDKFALCVYGQGRK